MVYNIGGCGLQDWWVWFVTLMSAANLTVLYRFSNLRFNSLPMGGGAAPHTVNHTHSLTHAHTLTHTHTQTQEAIVKIMKMRKQISNAALQTELVEILKNMFIPPKKMIKEQIEWLIEHKYMKRNDKDRNTFIYLA